MARRGPDNGRIHRDNRRRDLCATRDEIAELAQRFYRSSDFLFLGRGATIIALVTEGDREVPAMADHLVVLPHTSGTLSTILEAVPLQLLASLGMTLAGVDLHFKVCGFSVGSWFEEGSLDVH